MAPAQDVPQSGECGSVLGCGGYWTLTNANSGKVLEIAGGSTADDAAAQPYTSNGGTNQQWQLIREGIQ